MRSGFPWGGGPEGHPQGGGLSGLQGGAGPGTGAPGAQGGPGGGPGRSVHLHPQAQAGELVEGPAGHRAQADDCGAVRTHGGPQLAGLPPGGGAVHRHGPEPRQPRQRPPHTSARSRHGNTVSG